MVSIDGFWGLNLYSPILWLLASEIPINDCLYFMNINTLVVTKKLLHTGQEKALWYSSNSQCGTRKWGKDWTSRPRRMRSVRWDSRQMGNCRVNYQQFPVWNLGTEPRAQIPLNMIVAWATSSAQCVTIPVKWETVEKQIRNSETADLKTKRNSPMTLRNGKRGLRGLTGTTPMFYIVPRAVKSVLLIPLLPPNL